MGLNEVNAREHERFMREALAEARLAYAQGEVPVGAVVVVNGEIIARAHNRRETLKDASAHAEMLALREAAQRLADWRLNEATVYVTMEPCPMCAGALVQFRVGRVVYGVDDPKAGAAGSVVELLREPRFNHQVEVIRGVLAEESRALLQEFFRALRAGDGRPCRSE
ncbi:MAG: CMP/dCMP deaminase zinc-binding protein [Clostridia bacterium 62_21]|nr:MAG: CMP/dCMP deaminase zinc-binding protein [Clostridia bacterium 62_21]